MNRENVIKALDDMCENVAFCDACPLGDNPYIRTKCLDTPFVNMPDEILEFCLGVAGIDDIPDEDPVSDPVNHPEHYTSGGIECIDAIAASMTPIEYAGFLKGQVLKYVWRYRLKGKPVEDLKKARYYLDRLIQVTEKEEVAV